LRPAGIPDLPGIVFPDNRDSSDTKGYGKKDITIIETMPRTNNQMPMINGLYKAEKARKETLHDVP